MNLLVKLKIVQINVRKYSAFVIAVHNDKNVLKFDCIQLIKKYGIN